jgi:glutamyl-Q tRNA(Asp) synthetase
LISALASYLDARAHDGDWLVRIEDVDAPRTVPGAAEDILATLDAYGMHTTQPVVWQSQRTEAYKEAFERLDFAGMLYPCGCTRKDIAEALVRQQQAHTRHATLAYPGTCRDGLHGGVARAWRLRVPEATECEMFIDRWQGIQKQNLGAEVGDFALRRADGLWAYQLAVVVDDAHAGMTHIVRGADLLDSTPRQIYLQRCLGLRTPHYLHVPLLTDAHGEKLSKQNGAAALPRSQEGILTALHTAAEFLGLRVQAPDVSRFHEVALQAWRVQVAFPDRAATLNIR